MNVQTQLVQSETIVPDGRFVEILTSNSTGDVIGYRFGGGQAGPNVMAAAYGQISEYLFDRLAELPTIPWMWGKLFIVNLDALTDTELRNPARLIAETPIDEVLMLPVAALQGDDATAAEQSYWATLKLCASLGMIQGRGIPTRHDWALDHMIGSLR